MRSIGSQLALKARALAAGLALLLPLAVTPTTAAAGPYTGLYVFGDSLSDNGNVYALTGNQVPVSPPYDSGRFTNGPVAAEVLAGKLGLGAGSFHDFAYGGAQTGLANLYPQLGNTGLLSQIADFQSGLPGAADAAALYMVWAGPNDFFAPGANAATVVNAVTNIATAVGTLYSLGARDILVPLMPDLGLLPSVNGDALESAGASFLSGQFNLALQGALGNLQAALPDLDLTVFDTFTLFHQAVAAPGAFGFTNVTQACLAGGDFQTGGVPCANPDGYLFWDDVHPTAKGHAIIGERMAAMVTPVPEPQTWALMAGGLVVLVGLGRRSRA